MNRCVVLLSGGVDSTTTLAIASNEGYEVYALSFNYGQRHVIELEAARNIAVRYGVINHTIIDFNMREIGGSALTSDMEVPKGRLLATDTHSQATDIPVTYVPARNTIFLSFALAYAETLGAQDIFIGVNAIDYSGYPDCRPAYLCAFEEMANLATRESVEGRMRFKIHAPLLYLTKGEIIKLGERLAVDYRLTWSCYDPGEDGRPCLACDSCLLRSKGFKEAGLTDI